MYTMIVFAGPFAECFDVVDSSPYLRDCEYDICAGQAMESICDDMVSYVTDCRATGIEIPGWRNMVLPCGKMISL